LINFCGVHFDPPLFKNNDLAGSGARRIFGKMLSRPRKVIRFQRVLLNQQVDVVGAGPAPDCKVDIATLAKGFKKRFRFFLPPRESLLGYRESLT